jgi:hypothetical protein
LLAKWVARRPRLIYPFYADHSRVDDLRFKECA